MRSGKFEGACEYQTRAVRSMEAVPMRVVLRDDDDDEEDEEDDEGQDVTSRTPSLCPL